MYIKKRVSQHRRDFTAVYKCEHCGEESEGSGYDDTYFHEHVIPRRECKGCGKASDGNVPFRPVATKYADGEVV